MEIPEHNPETIPRIKNTAYWPYAKYIPVLSEAAMKKLAEKGVLEVGKDNNGDDSLRIKIKDKGYVIPRVLTSKKALLFLGFTKEKVDELWNSLIKVNPPVITPSISDGGEWAFWFELKLWIGDEIYAITKRTADKRDDAWNNTVLGRVGLNDSARLHSLKIKGEKGQVTTFIQEQKPQDLLPLFQRYIYHRWNILAKLDKLVLSDDNPDDIFESDWWSRLTEEFEKTPLDLDVLYGRRVTWEHIEWKCY